MNASRRNKGVRRFKDGERKYVHDMKKELCATTCFHGDLTHAGRHFEKRDIDALMQYAASIGAARFKWMYDTNWTLYEPDSPVGFDLIETACESAHRHGMRFDAIFKPFEGALWHRTTILPDSFPRPAGAPVLATPIGLLHVVRPSLVDHPEMRLARRPGEAADPGGSIATIRLLKNDDAPFPVAPDDLSIWTSHRNGGLKPYEGTVAIRDSLEWRPGFPDSDRKRRVLSLENLDLPESIRLVVIRRGQGREAGDFANTGGGFAELVRADGTVIPSMVSGRRVDAEALYRRTAVEATLGAHRYLQLPEVAALVGDRDRFMAHCEGMFDFRTQSKAVSLGPGKELAILRGKHRCVYGAPHPVYPEVRRDWLGHVQYCIDRGVDGVNIRIASHNFGGCHEPWAYGFNEPVLAQMDHPENTAEAARINGEAFTTFLRAARDLLHANGKEIGVQVHARMFGHDERDPGRCPLPRNFDWNWDEWIRDIADYVELRGGFSMCEANNREAADRVGLAARQADIPFIYQGNRLAMNFDGPHPSLAREMDWTREHPDITVYDLYETGNFTRINPRGEFEGSPAISDLARKHWRKR